METNKNSLATGMLAVVVLAAVFLVGILIFWSPGHDVAGPDKIAKPAAAAKGAERSTTG